MLSQNVQHESLSTPHNMKLRQNEVSVSILLICPAELLWVVCKVCIMDPVEYRPKVGHFLVKITLICHSVNFAVISIHSQDILSMQVGPSGLYYF